MSDAYDRDLQQYELDTAKAYIHYIESNLERIERGGWTPVCFKEFVASEELDTHMCDMAGIFQCCRAPIDMGHMFGCPEHPENNPEKP